MTSKAVPRSAGVAAAIGAATFWLAAAAQTPAPASPPPPAASPAPAAAAGKPASDEPVPARQQRQNELHGVEDTIRAGEEQRRKTEADIEAMRNDRARLNAALIETTARAQATEARVGDAEKRLDVSQASEAAIRRSLEGRRGVIAEVLAALQRMGRKPPPAVLVRPQDMLEAIRTSMLLASVVPQLKAETQALAGDLADLVQVRKGIAAERDSLDRELASLGAERKRLAALVDARQSALADAERSLDAQRDRMRDLAHKAADLKDLIARMEADDAANRAAQAARDAEAARRAAAPPSPEAPTRVAMGPFRDPARLAPAIAFGDAKGLLPLPVSGSLLKSFGDADGFGGSEKGMSFATRANAIVSAPADGWVRFSGPYRSYGQLLIIDTGGGYYVILAGMERINVEVGQFILAGEPVATMGDGSRKTAAAVAIGAVEPTLYVEFRKDGVAIDPGPWWVKPELEKVRG
jgi:septal ring factor EnvC (AmiA/AmiB activator)